MCTLNFQYFYSQKIFHQISYLDNLDKGEYFHLLAIPKKERLERVLKYMLDEDEFLSPYGIRSLSKVHKDHPFVMDVGGERYTVGYVPGESNTYIFGGNSNWRGPIWLCCKLKWTLHVCVCDI